MKPASSLRQPARVEMHLDGQYTRLILFRLADGFHRVEIPTEKIPLHLRRIGSEFILVMPRFTPEPGDSADLIREACAEILIEELRDHQDT